MFKQKKVGVSFFIFLLLGMLVFGADPSRKIVINAAPTGKEPPPYAENEVLVKFKPGVSLNSINQLAIEKSLIVKKHFRILSRLTGCEYVLLKSADLNTAEMMSALEFNLAVEAVSPNYRNFLDATPNDTRYSELWGMNNTGQTGGATDADIDAPAAWDYNTGSSSVVVAVIDTGLDYKHPDLAANVWVNAAEYSGTAGVDDDGNGYIDDIYGIDTAGINGSAPDTDPMDGFGHGTHCAGTIGAVGNNSLGVVGVNWNVKIMGLKFFDNNGGNGYDSFAIECIEYAIDQKINYSQNVVAINASWGSYSFDQLLKDAVEAAGAQGIVFCAAAGNDTIDNDTDPHYPASFDSSNIIAVAATDHNDLIASFSNYGATTVDLGAPGSSILSTVPGTYTAQSGDIFFDNMEGGAGNWVHGGTLDTWAISEDQEGFASASFPVPSPPHFWSDSPGANYQNSTDSWLAYNADIDLTGYVGQDIFFGIGAAKYIHRYDHFIIEFSNNSGGSWTMICDWGYDGHYYRWWHYSWLIPEAFKTAHFRMRFRLVSDATYQGWGWLIDNVGIGTSVVYGYESWGGTSMATPHVAGAVALMAAEYPAEAMADRIDRILSNVDANASLAGKCVTGGRLNLFNAISDISDSITVTSPNGGENWNVGDSHNITWSSTGLIANVQIDYSTNGGSTWGGVIASTANDGTYSWTVPNTPSANCLVRIGDAADLNPVDISNAVFSISSPASETVSTPSIPSGPSSGLRDTSYSFSTGGSNSNFGHSIQYRIDWGDGFDSGWLAVGTTSASHAWTTNGTYNIRAMARCATHTAIESAWSESHSILISDTGSAGYYNSPADRVILPEVNWALASGGGTWMVEAQVIDISGGSQVSVYYNHAGGRRGPFLLWTGTAPGSSVRFDCLLDAIDQVDSGTFTYYGTVGAVEFVTQDGSHLIQVAMRQYNGNYSKTHPGLADVAATTADVTRQMVIPNLASNATYRTFVGCFNPTADSVTVEFRLADGSGAMIGTTVTRTIAGYGYDAFNVFTEAGVPYPGSSYSNAACYVHATSGTGRVMCFGATANNSTNDPAAHVAVQTTAGYENSPASRVILPEVNWALASGGGTWMVEAQVIDISGGSQVSVYYNHAGGRRGPFLLWTGTAPGSSVRFDCLLDAIDQVDGGAFTYYGTVGAVEFVTQDGSHLIQVSMRQYNGNYSKTHPGLADVEATTADVTRQMVIPNLASNATYRTFVGCFNPSADSVTVEFRLADGSGAMIGTTVTRTIAGYGYDAFNVFTEAGVPYPGNSYSNAACYVHATSGTGRVMCFGATANNSTNDPAAHIAVQGQ